MDLAQELSSVFIVYFPGCLHMEIMELYFNHGKFLVFSVKKNHWILAENVHANFRNHGILISKAVDTSVKVVFIIVLPLCIKFKELNQLTKLIELPA